MRIGPGDVTSLQQRLQEVLQAVGEAAHHVAGVAVLREEEGQLEVRILLQLNLSAIAPRELIGCVLCHSHHVWQHSPESVSVTSLLNSHMLMKWKSCENSWMVRAALTRHRRSNDMAPVSVCRTSSGRRGDARYTRSAITATLGVYG
ncbi:hypothetical protein EYF80_033653 [Liparis tanakae]|uniref:Uncharacterized protein n=1 Tax=Liparis tanakae TaxID=230148 RepID=A0A4Z2GTI4_9TELE|nr:hypothetical protein EYF80_033653 [Liparis tanakae]